MLTAPADDEFGFIGVEGPPAKSLLVADLLPADSAVQSYLNVMYSTLVVPRHLLATISRLFELEDVVSSRWPEVLPVVCL